MSLGLFRCQQSGTHLFLYPGMVFCDLSYAVLVDQIGAAVAHIRHVHFAPEDDGCYESRPHATLGWIRLGLRVDLLVGRLQGPNQASAHIVGLVGVVVLDSHFHSSPTCHLARLVTTHAVSDQVDSSLVCFLLWVRRNEKVHIILVVWPHAAGVGKLDSYQIDFLRRHSFLRVCPLVGQWIWYNCLVAIHENLPRCLP